MDAILCYCSGHCPSNANLDYISSNNINHNSTCLTKPGGWCYASVQEVYDELTNTLESEYSYGCLPPEESGLLQCKGDLSPHVIPRSVKCCSSGDMCNVNLRPSYISRTKEIYGIGHGNRNSMTDAFLNLSLGNMLLAIIPSILLIIAIIALIVVLRKRYFKKSSKESNSSDLSMIDESSESNGGKYNYHRSSPNSMNHDSGFDSCGKAMYGEHSSSNGHYISSGTDVPLLVQRTVASQLDHNNGIFIGGGRFGTVYRAMFHGDAVAVKIFKTTEESSWKREHDIFRTNLLRHKNILGFIAADIHGTGGQTQMLLITEYHHLGSLYDYLNRNVLNVHQALLLMYSAMCGLDHLHGDINTESVNERKPSIAHRDIKSKNILVKSDGTCCIADFGLCVVQDATNHSNNTNQNGLGSSNWSHLNLTTNPRDSNVRVGTKRYMAPEVLDETIKISDFESFKRCDIYSMSLVIWEIIRRTATRTIDNCINYEPYNVPYQDVVPNDPSFDDMKKIVCKPNNLRPGIENRWYQNEYLAKISGVMRESWSATPKARPSALRVKKFLGNLEQEARREILESMKMMQTESDDHLSMTDNKMNISRSRQLSSGCSSMSASSARSSDSMIKPRSLILMNSSSSGRSSSSGGQIINNQKLSMNLDNIDSNLRNNYEIV